MPKARHFPPGQQRLRPPVDQIDPPDKPGGESGRPRRPGSGLDRQEPDGARGRRHSGRVRRGRAQASGADVSGPRERLAVPRRAHHSALDGRAHLSRSAQGPRRLLRPPEGEARRAGREIRREVDSCLGQ